MKPKYMIIKDHLIDRFLREDFVPGQKLPTEQDLVESFNSSRTTVRQALALLEEEGIIKRIHGSGSYYKGKIDKESDQSVKNTKLIGLLNFFQLDYIYSEILRGIEDTLSDAGYSLVVASSNQNDIKQSEVIKRLIDQGIAGLILEPNRILQNMKDHPALKMIEEAGIPVVTTHWGVSNKRISTITNDDVQAGYEAGRYLTQRGHKHIGILYKEDIQAGHDRYSGFLKALEDVGVFVDPSMIKTFNTSEELKNPRLGYIKTIEMLDDSKNRPTAIFYFNDLYALQGYSAIREMGLSIPEDISVIGFDNFNTTEMVDPPLTTFEHPKYDLGKWAAKILLDELTDSKPRLPMKMIFEPMIVERESVKDLTLN